MVSGLERIRVFQTEIASGVESSEVLILGQIAGEDLFLHIIQYVGHFESKAHSVLRSKVVIGIEVQAIEGYGVDIASVAVSNEQEGWALYV